MRRSALTRKQQAIYDYLVSHQEELENPPTLDELCRAMGVTSRGSMHKHVQALIDAGLVEPMGHKHRGVRLTPQAEEEERGVPFLGFIAAGRPIENPQAMEVPAALRGKGETFVLQVRGESMVEEGILDGDWVVIERRNHARNGEIVVALVDGREATLKRIEQKRSKVILYPANSQMIPMEYKPDQIQIQGVLVGQMRAYR